MRSIVIIFCLFVFAFAVVAADQTASDIPSTVWQCIYNAGRTDPSLESKVKACIGAGGDVAACLKAIPSIALCFK
jgi:hypothetical protein